MPQSNHRYITVRSPLELTLVDIIQQVCSRLVDMEAAKTLWHAKRTARDVRRALGTLLLGNLNQSHWQTNRGCRSKEGTLRSIRDTLDLHSMP